MKPTEKNIKKMEMQTLIGIYLLYKNIELNDVQKEMLPLIEKRLEELK